jgi:hypothetical protein
VLYVPTLLFLLLKLDFKLLHQFGEIWLTVVAPHLTVVVTDTTAQSRPTSLVSGGRAFWVVSIAQAERDTRATHVHSNTGA